MSAPPGPAVLPVRDAVRRCLADLDLGPDDTVLMGCSGGADSLALAAALAHTSQRVGRSTRRPGWPVRAGAVIVDHGLQAGSAAVAAATAATCRELGLDPVLVITAKVQERGSPEEAARAARYQAFETAIAEYGARALLLGHSLDDQAEQVLLALARGSGARSLAGIPPARGPYRRPLLGLTRADLAAACHAQGLTPWQDPTNAESGEGAPLRNRVRHELLPALERVLGPGTTRALARTATLARADVDLLDALAASLLDNARVGEHAFRVEALRAAPPATRTRALRQAALAAGASPADTTSRQIAQLDALLVNWRGQGAVSLAGGTQGWRECGNLYLGSISDRYLGSMPDR
ncbi:MAG: tRNA lysidine(34) synthetase TilS [Promicromonosporaceae bacterium]|nr:tRNA lysidine(34) synthetase TilS [Promicromonosporaceae bacterium]